MAFAALGKRPFMIPFPLWMARACAAGTLPYNARAAHFTRFAAHVMTHDCLAPRLGTLRLENRFRAYANPATS
ncbi:MAG TPA: hypothetical protein VEB22_08490, partial [Phycisphaerales bacterium]|nr:hypothetical protein [Phycisphaerales bacterium]